MEADDFFSGFPQAKNLFEEIMYKISYLGPIQLKTSKSQISLIGQSAFAYFWIPGRYLKGRSMAPLVLSILLSYYDKIVLWKEVTKIKEHWYMHHLEIWEETSLTNSVLSVLDITFSGGKPIEK
ncbi:hypothetical protein [Sphaerochaeta halotolerans]|uniref:hypothetical protein n=1 Tax=Sphaerochaeta halotolerans TaxID=2293840 RepID=UPI00136B44A3|nr:hypothetical protein [Sphaerochaeta halotolerans]MXI86059.1 hypothetical protein [Sphaerochaeta halotolerans]